VTGGAGFIGANFVRFWADAHPDDHVVVYDLLTYAGNRANLAGVENSVTFVRGDICDQATAEHTMRDSSVDAVVNFAAESWTPTSRSASSPPTGPARRTTPPKREPTTPCGPTTRPTGCR